MYIPVTCNHPDCITNGTLTTPIDMSVTFTRDWTDDDETEQILRDHPELLDRLAEIAREGSRGRPLRDVAKDLDK